MPDATAMVRYTNMRTGSKHRADHFSINRPQLFRGPAADTLSYSQVLLSYRERGLTR
jgi:hypothetical protein